MSGTKNSEFGQTMVLVALGMLVILGFSSLAIDGGRIYLDRRRAQNAADQAAMAGALAKVQGVNLTVAGLNQAANNEFNNDGVTNVVTIYNPPISGVNVGDIDYVQVIITMTSETSLVQFVYDGETKITVEAVARAKNYNSLFFSLLTDNAIVTTGNCNSDGGHSLEFTGGGNSGGVVTKNGGIFLNSNEGIGGCCALDPPNNGYGIISDGPITNVGACDYSGESMIHPLPVDIGFNNGVPVGDPLATVLEPTCTSAGTKSGSTYYPGNWDGGDFDGDVNLQPENLLYFR